MNKIHISENSDESFEELNQNQELEGNQEIGRTLSALSRLDTPPDAYRRGFVEELEAGIDKQLSDEAEQEAVLDILMDLPDESYLNLEEHLYNE